MYRFTATGSTCTGRIITVYVTAKNREDAINAAFDDMGIICMSSCRKISKKPLTTA